MKIILSHDVDHWKWNEHITDGYLLKFLLKNVYYGVIGKISLRLVFKRIYSIRTNKISQLESLLEYEQSLGVPSTIFIGISNALSLSYSNHTARKIIDLVKSMNFKIGIHGIEFDNIDKMREEKACFEELSGLDEVGIRNHYLRISENTYTYMAK